MRDVAGAQGCKTCFVFQFGRTRNKFNSYFLICPVADWAPSNKTNKLVLGAHWHKHKKNANSKKVMIF